MTSRLLAVCIDARDPLGLARFWAGVLGCEAAGDPEGGIVLAPVDETAFRIRFLPAREQLTGQNHWHLHLTSTSLQDQRRTVARLLGLGARHVDVGQRPGEGHVVLADPEGNLLCVIEPGNKYLVGCGFLAEITCEGSRDAGYFWSEALGWPLVWDRGPQTAIQSPEARARPQPPPCPAPRGRHARHRMGMPWHPDLGSRPLRRAPVPGLQAPPNPRAGLVTRRAGGRRICVQCERERV